LTNAGFVAALLDCALIANSLLLFSPCDEL
jgi:hypothetical protein